MGGWLKSMLYFEWLVGTHINLASYVMVVVFVFTALWAWTFKRDYIFEGAPSQHRWRDIRIWAVILLAVQTVLYVHFGIK
jgi:hypothetical protein